ncbi:hypothetical protein KJ713_02025 [Patescibacteria group bacterium]|nr:hypothetical protein [Patescibacteria group bacterium]
MPNWLKVIIKIFVFILLYFLIFCFLVAIEGSFNFAAPVSESGQRIVKGVSYLLPLLIESKFRISWETMWYASFNPYFLILNILYTYLVYKLLFWGYRKIKTRKPVKAE